MTDRYLYSLYGVTVSLPFACFTLPELSGETVPDITVVEGRVPRRLEAPGATGENWEASPGRYLLRGGRRAGRFLVEGGERITLERNPAAEDAMLAGHFLAAVIAALMRQRGCLVLHANTLALEGRGIAISGTTGAGKSTTLSALLAGGATMVSDDVTVVRRGESGRIEALPGIPKLNLCEDAALALGQDVVALPRSPLRRIKVVATHRGPMATGPVPLHTLYQLGITSGSEVRLVPRTGAGKFDALQSCVYGPMFPDEHSAQFPLFATMAERLAMFRIERPESRWCLDTVAEKIHHG